MQYTRLLIALTLLIALAPGVVVADIIGSPELDVTVEEDSFAPGEETPLELTVTNSGDLRDGSNQNQQLNDRVTTARDLQQYAFVWPRERLGAGARVRTARNRSWATRSGRGRFDARVRG
jgi:hypothetical protein